MQFQSLSMFCNCFFRSYRVPVTCMSGESLLFQYPSALKLLNIPSLVMIPEEEKNDVMAYFTAFDILLFGRVVIPQSDNHMSLIVGPVTNTVLSSGTIKIVLDKMGLNQSDDVAFLNMVSNIPVISLERFFDVVSFVNYCLTDEWVESRKFLNKDESALIRKIENSRAVFSIQAKERQLPFNNSYYLGKQLSTCIRCGDFDGLVAIDQNYAQSTVPRILSEDNLRNNKDIFITVATMITQAAVEGGLDIEIAYELSDSYIRQCENATSLQQIAQLFNRITVDFVTKVKACQIPQNISSLSFQCIQYISSHTNEPLTVNGIAEHFNTSRSHLSAIFRQELGFTIKDFIVKRKIEEAKSLLTYTNITISEISNYLYFSSQAHFQAVFKKSTGVTPQNYRKKIFK